MVERLTRGRQKNSPAKVGASRSAFAERFTSLMEWTSTSVEAALTTVPTGDTASLRRTLPSFAAIRNGPRTHAGSAGVLRDRSLAPHNALASHITDDPAVRARRLVGHIEGK